MKFKKYEVIWFIILLALLAAAAGLPALFGAAPMQWILISCISAIVLIAVYRILDIRSWNSIVSEHYYSCDLHAFVEEIQELINAKYVFKSTKTRTQFLIVEALLDSGKFEQSFSILQAIDIKKLPRRFSRSHYDYLCYSVKYHIYTEDKNAAETELILLKMETEKHQSNRPVYRNLAATYIDLQNRLMFLKQEYRECREYFTGIYESADKTPYEKCFAAHYLGILSLERKETERAKDCFTYITENGNTLFIVEDAGQRLSLMNKEKKAAQA